MRFDFDQIEKGYEQELNRALAFSGKGADFFAEVRASLLISLCEENIGDPKRMSVLDVGSGIGLLERHIAGRFGRIHGVDVSLETVRQARLENDRCRFDVYDGEHLPFQDDSFDIVFSSCVLEYLPPEKVFQFFGEMRRVLKHHGLLLLGPAWDCTPWAAQGYPVRPYSDFSLAGKLIKASIPIHSTLYFLSKVPIRLLRYGAWAAMRQPTKFHYRRLTPNYDQYWMPDSDAVNSLDHYEAALWFVSRGDDCLNCETAMHGWMDDNFPLIIRINKQAPAQ